MSMEHETVKNNQTIDNKSSRTARNKNSNIKNKNPVEEGNIRVELKQKCKL